RGTPSHSGWVRWLVLSFLGSTLLLATTHHLCQYVASVPFLWVLPLAVYLITFAITFESDRWYRPRLFAVLMAIAALVGCTMLAIGLLTSLAVQAVSYLFVLFIGCMVCHGELARSRPPVADLTRFYLLVSGGGILGGV